MAVQVFNSLGVAIESKHILSIDIGMRNLGLTVLTCDVTDRDILAPIPWSCVRVLHFENIDILQDDAHEDTKKQETHDEDEDDDKPVTIREFSDGKTEKKQKGKGKQKQNAREINIHDACRRTIDALFRRTQLLEGVTDIRVEQQPISRGFGGGGGGGAGGGASGSVRMKIMQHCILTFYETYFLLHPPARPIRIEASSPTNKLKCVIEQDDVATKPLGSSAKGTDYKTRKAQAVTEFDRMIEWCQIAPALKAKYQDMKKQNDVADSALQALYEIQMYLCKMRQKAKSKQAQAEKRGQKRKVCATDSLLETLAATTTTSKKKRLI